MTVRPATALTSLLLFALAAPAAHAATATVEAGALRITAAPGEYNAIGIAAAPGGLSVTDAGAPLTLGPGCTTGTCVGARRVARARPRRAVGGASEGGRPRTGGGRAGCR